MFNSKIPSPARSQGSKPTPRRYRQQRTRSLASPARSENSVKLTALIPNSFIASPLPERRSILNDETNIEIPSRPSWWKKLDENSRDIVELLETNNMPESNNMVEDMFSVEVLSQGKENSTLDFLESDCESVQSIVLPPRKLFGERDKKVPLPSERFAMPAMDREDLAKLQKSQIDNNKTIDVRPKNLFNQGKKTKPIFPSRLLNISAEKSITNKTIENPVLKTKGTIFGKGQGTKRRNMFADCQFILSESENEMPEIQPKVFGFNKRNEQKRRYSQQSTASNRMQLSPSSSIADTDMEDWQHLPSSTMVENQIEELAMTPKRVKLSNIIDNRESNFNTSITNKTKLSNESRSKSRQSSNKSNTKNKTLEPDDDNNSKKANKTINKSKNANSSKRNETLKEKQASSVIQENILDKKSINQTQRNKNNDDEQNNSFDEDFTLEYENEEENPEVPEEQLQLNKTTKNKSKLEKTLNATIRHIPQDDIIENDKNNISVSKSTQDLNGSKRKSNISTRSLSKSINTYKIEDLANNSAKTQNKSVISNNESRSNKSKLEHSKTIDKNLESENVHDNRNREQGLQISKEGEMQDNLVNKSDIGFAEDNIELEVQGNSVLVDVPSDVEMEESERRDSTEEKTEQEQSDAKESEPEDMEEDQESEQENEDAQNQTEDDKNETTHDQSINENASAGEMNVEQSDVDANEASDAKVNEQSNDEENDQNEDENVQSHVEENEESDAEVNEESDAEENEKSDAEVNEESEAEENEQSEAEENEQSETEENEQSDAEENKEQISTEANEQSDVEENEPSEAEANEQSYAEANEQSDAEAIEQSDGEAIEQSDAEAIEQSDAEANEESDAEANEQSDAEANEDSDAEVNEQSDIEPNEQSDAEANEQSDADQNEEQSDVEVSEDHNDTEENDNESDTEMNNEQNESDEEERDSSQHHETSQEINESDQNETNKQSKTNNVTNDPKNETHLEQPEAVLDRQTKNIIESFTLEERNNPRKTKSVIKNLKPSLAPVRESTGFSDFAQNSSAEGASWDSHRTTRKTLRQTFGKDFTPRKSLRALVMEKSAKRTTFNIGDISKHPNANSTELPGQDRLDGSMDYEIEETRENDHEASRIKRQTTMEMYLKKFKQRERERSLKIKEEVLNSLKRDHQFKMPYAPRRNVKPVQKEPRKAKSNTIKTTILPLEYLPADLLEDMKYKPPKRYQPPNASWATKRLYKFLEEKLEPKYEYKARVRAEKLVEMLYTFTKAVRKGRALDHVDEVKTEMARLNIVRTHYEFYQFFHDYMPREIRVRVVPDVVNKLPMPKPVFGDIIPAPR